MSRYDFAFFVLYCTHTIHRSEFGVFAITPSSHPCGSFSPTYSTPRRPHSKSKDIVFVCSSSTMYCTTTPLTPWSKTAQRKKRLPKQTPSRNTWAVPRARIQTVQKSPLQLTLMASFVFLHKDIQVCCVHYKWVKVSSFVPPQSSSAQRQIAGERASFLFFPSLTAHSCDRIQSKLSSLCWYETTVQ